MSNAVVKVNGSQAMLPTVLGQGPVRIPTGGKIRAGIKVLTAKAAAHLDARAIYERGMAAGDSFVQIEQALTKALPQLKSPLVPKNVSWFTVRGQDFSNPEIARQILDAHGEDRGDGIKRLYRFPVVFPSDFWQVVMPHELAAWGAAEKHYWSEYSPDGRVRYCKQHASVPFDDTGKRAIRLFGGRKTMLREQNGGLCDPESCREYQRRQCNLTGRFLFFIPGIRSISAFELHTNSFYAMNMAIQKFETISFLRGGRISGFLDSQRTPFYLTKKLMDVARIDEQGRAVRVPQWIIDLEAPVDVTALIRHNEDEGAAIVQAQRAAHVLDDTLGPGDGADTADQPPAGAELADNQLQRQPESEVGWRDIVTKGATLEKITEKVQSYGIDLAQYEAYADQRWGRGWRFNAFGRHHAQEELERYRNDPKGYLDKIDCATRGAGLSGPRAFKAGSGHALDLNEVGGEDDRTHPIVQRTRPGGSMIRIAQFSDLHYSAKNLVEADRCFSHAVDRAIALKVDAAVVSGDSTDHALDLHSPAVERLACNVRRLADHCSVLMLQGTFSHEPPGTLSMFRLLGGRYPVHVADRIGQLGLTTDGRWTRSEDWQFSALPSGLRALFSCVPTVNKAVVAATVGASSAADAVGEHLAVLLRGFAASNQTANARGLPTIGVSHGTVFGCISEHGVPMAGFDHEFTTGALFAAEAQAFMLGHIHRYQAWEHMSTAFGGSAGHQCIAYSGSIGRFHHGEEGDKGFLLWEIGAGKVRFTLEPTPARRTLDIVFEGKPDLNVLQEAVEREGIAGAFVRVRWTVADEDRHEVDRAAMQALLEGAAEVKLEGRIVPVVRTRAAGISQLASLADKVRVWAHSLEVKPEPLLDCLQVLASQSPEAIAEQILCGTAAPTAEVMAELSLTADAETEPALLF